MAKEAEDQAKQLDSVTDVVQEQEVDATKALQAMNELSDKNNSTTGSSLLADQLKNIAVSKDDVDLIVSELEISQELAEQTLRQVALERIQQQNNNNNDCTTTQQHSLVVAALRKLVTS